MAFQVHGRNQSLLFSTQKPLILKTIFSELPMFKFVLPALAAAVFSIPFSAQANDCCAPQVDCCAPQVDCCAPQADCCPQPCCQRQRCFEFRCVTRQVCRLRLVCTTDACGCPRRSLRRVPTTVTRRRLVRVNRGCGCDNHCGSACNSGCGCGN